VSIKKLFKSNQTSSSGSKKMMYPELGWGN